MKGKNDKYDFANNMKKFNLMQIHLHEVKILQIHNARPEFVKQISHQSESSIFIWGVINFQIKQT
jgi:hypothetical protein